MVDIVILTSLYIYIEKLKKELTKEGKEDDKEKDQQENVSNWFDTEKYLSHHSEKYCITQYYNY